MINIQEFLNDNSKERGTYSLVTYENKTYPIWFSSFSSENGFWFLESPCSLYIVDNHINEDCIYEYAKVYVEDLLSDDADVDEYINNFVLPMIIDGVLYEIENFQCAPYLPTKVDHIKLISERECLEYLLKTQCKTQEQ